MPPTNLSHGLRPTAELGATFGFEGGGVRWARICGCGSGDSRGGRTVCGAQGGGDGGNGRGAADVGVGVGPGVGEAVGENTAGGCCQLGFVRAPVNCVIFVRDGVRCVIRMGAVVNCMVCVRIAARDEGATEEYEGLPQ